MPRQWRWHVEENRALFLPKDRCIRLAVNMYGSYAITITKISAQTANETTENL